MLSTKTRNTIVALVASVSFAGATVVPTIAQAETGVVAPVGGMQVTPEGGTVPPVQGIASTGRPQTLVFRLGRFVISSR